jgi:hypothetical protein
MAAKSQKFWQAWGCKLNQEGFFGASYFKLLQKTFLVLEKHSEIQPGRFRVLRQNMNVLKANVFGSCRKGIE